jgi:hypothetical protein
VRDTLYTRALLLGVQVQGSTQALASALHVPENTMLRWMSGRAQTPVEAFCKVIELLVEHEKMHGGAIAEAGQPRPAPQALEFAMGGLLARCVRCEGTEFALVPPATTLMYTSELHCRGCDTAVIHASLVATLARQAVHYAHAKRQPPRN